MNMGWFIIYWPGTECAMYVGDWDGDMETPEGGVFLPLKDGPPPGVEARPRNQEDQRLELNALMQDAETQKSAFSTRIGVLKDAVKYDIATEDEIAELKLRTSTLEEWEKYAVLLGRVKSQPEWSDSANWPVPPSERL